jgi:nucleoid DNA-binding protein
VLEEMAKNQKLSKSKLEETLNLTLDSMKTVIKKHKALQLVGFGTFKVKQEQQEWVLNPQNRCKN